jgi:hypothetical protein
MLLAALLCTSVSAAALEGVVYNAADRSPLAGATIISGSNSAISDDHGRFQLSLQGATVSARAPGFGRLRQARANVGADGLLHVSLAPFQPKALYLSFYGIGSDVLRGAALALLEHTELNALVVDVKSDRGMLPYASRIALAEQVGAQKLRTVGDMPALVAQLHRQGVYLIARVVVFKDERLASARPDLAVRNAQGELWRDGENQAWTDPMRSEAWQYNLDVAEEAASMGFDEIQFDYVRFPDAVGLQFARANTAANRIDAITGFLGAARRRLAPYNVFLGADIFGYVLWNADDTAIGQQLETLSESLDYICPMLYPSGFKWGLPELRNPVEHPYQIVYRSLQRARQRTGLPGARFRPWLQAFTDYAFDRRVFGAAQIQAQADAARDAGSNGWMLWNARNRYSAGGLQCEGNDCLQAPAAQPGVAVQPGLRQPQ